MSVNKAKTVKVSVENIESKEQILYEINLENSLEQNIRDIREKFQQPQSSVYGLKLISQKDGKPLHTYITDANFEKCLQDGCFLKLVYSLEFYVSRIFDHINDKYKERSFQDLYELSVDPEFIKEIVKNEKQSILFEVFTTSELTESEATACLMAITHLFQRHYITDISGEFLNKVIFFTKNGQNSEVLKYSLSVIYKILCHRDVAFSKWKEEIFQQVTILDLISMIKTRQTEDLRYACLLLINGMLRCCKGEKKKQLIREIDKKSVREAIYEHCIANEIPNKQLAHELYLYQTNLLR